MASGGDLRGKSLLTNREREVFELLVQDKTTKEIAKQLFVSEKTVRNHISNVIHLLVLVPHLRVPVLHLLVLVPRLRMLALHTLVRSPLFILVLVRNLILTRNGPVRQCPPRNVHKHCQYNGSWRRCKGNLKGAFSWTAKKGITPRFTAVLLTAERELPTFAHSKVQNWMK
jgi:LuxR family transcriptional regulator, transcriptional regulator of spore coat protein